MRYGSIVSRAWILAAALQVAGPVAVAAGEADVVGVEVARSADGTHRFDVTVRHADEGWEHYADRWEVVAPDGTVLGAHPVPPPCRRAALHPVADRRRDRRGRRGGHRPRPRQRPRRRRRDGDGAVAGGVMAAGAGAPNVAGAGAASPGAVDRSRRGGRFDGRFSR